MCSASTAHLWKHRLCGQWSLKLALFNLQEKSTTGIRAIMTMGWESVHTESPQQIRRNLTRTNTSQKTHVWTSPALLAFSAGKIHESQCWTRLVCAGLAIVDLERLFAGDMLEGFLKWSYNSVHSLIFMIWIFLFLFFVVNRWNKIINISYNAV